MGLPHIYCIMNKISDLSEETVLNQTNNIGRLRQHVRILIIDDNEFMAENHLKSSGYQIDHKYDIDTIKDVEPYEIIMCDISGVGKKLGFEKEGAFIIREIHENYPNKIIIAYTSYTYNADYNQFFALADFVVAKDIPTDDWIGILDEQVRNAINPIQQWKRIRNYLFDNNVSTITIAQIEDKYVKSIKKKDFKVLTSYISGGDLKLNTIITDFASSLCAKLILGALSGGI